MAKDPHRRRLAAILAADVAAYSRLMNEAEDETISAWYTARDQVIDPVVSRHDGRIVKHTGDGFLAEFATATEAVRCAIEMQVAFKSLNAEVAQNRRLEFRMGINLGEITVDENDIHGDGVNIAARLESLAEPGGIWVSATVHDQVHKKIEHGFEDMGHQRVKNIAQPVSCYRVALDGRMAARAQTAVASPVRRRHGRLRLLILAILVALIAAAIWGPETPSQAPPETSTLEVQPFRVIGGNPAHRSFSEGLTEDVVTALSAIRSIRVAADTARRRPSAAQARYVFEGSVRGESRIRITAQLIDTRTGFHVWGGRFDRQMTDALAQQAEVSAKIAVSLAETFARLRAEELAAAESGRLSGMLFTVLRMIGNAVQSAVAMPGEIIGRLSKSDGGE